MSSRALKCLKNPAGLPLSALDLDLLAQRNAFVYWMNTHAPEMAEEKVAVFGIHATQMYALILQNGCILYKQETPVSTEQLNQLIQAYLSGNGRKSRTNDGFSKQAFRLPSLRLADRLMYRLRKKFSVFCNFTIPHRPLILFTISNTSC